MRIAYGVHGYSRGHSTRALAILRHLQSKHEVRVFAGGDAAQILAGLQLVPVPSLGFSYRAGQRSNLGTLQRNWPLIRDLVVRGPHLQKVLAEFREFRPEVVISDAEPWTHAAGRALGIPRIAFDHFGVLVHCDVRLPFWDWVKSALDRGVYRWLTRFPTRILVSSFFRAPPRSKRVHVVGPIVREEVRAATVTNRGYLLAYFNQASLQLSPKLFEALQQVGVPIILYGTGSDGVLGNVRLRPPGVRTFVEDLAGCSAVLSTAGNQLVGEAMALGKPMLVAPETTVEQRLNARQLVLLGIGERVEMQQLNAAVIRGFLQRADGYRARCLQQAHDGQAEAAALVEHWLNTLSEPAPQGAPRRFLRPSTRTNGAFA